jgi:hypothetical protein
VSERKKETKREREINKYRESERKKQKKTSQR